PCIPYPGPPPGNRNGRPHVRVVCEVGNGQSTKEWNDKKNDLGQYHRSMTARLWQQGTGYQEWQFGTLIRKKQTPTTCNAPNLPQYQVIIPISQVFWDPVLPLPPAVEDIQLFLNPLATETAPVNFIIDLYRVQQLVLSEQDNA
ncbi:10352_t:CDS:2, partial [Entrophospora sp. SA101]